MQRIFRLVDLTAQVMTAENLPDALNEFLRKLLILSGAVLEIIYPFEWSAYYTVHMSSEF
jgi:hypothetical protein